jgi:hypothetical protein
MASSPLVIGNLHGKDPLLPSSGPHADFRYRKKGSDVWENPAFGKSVILKNIGVGDKNLPLYVSDNNTWKLNPEVGAVLTSGYGPRNTGIPGASRYHVGHDYSGGLLSKPGTRLSWLGNVSDRKVINESSSMIVTKDPNSGQEYEVSFLHVKPDKTPFAGGTFTGTPSQPQSGVGIAQNPSSQGQQFIFNVDIGEAMQNLLAEAKAKKEESQEPPSLFEQFKQSVIAQALGSNPSA